MKQLLLIVIVVTVSINAAVLNTDQAWAKFKLDHGRHYRSLREDTERREIFTENYKRVQEHNKLYEQGLVKYYLKVNSYFDLSPKEMRETMTGFERDETVGDLVMEYYEPDESVVVPEEFDWRTKGAVTDVRNQTRCRSSWAFSAVAALESQNFIKTGKLVALSPQNLMDCSRDYSTKGCKGGDFLRAFIYVHENDGIDSEESYPYEAVDRRECLYQEEYNVTSTPGFAFIHDDNEDHLKIAVATIGPVSIAFNGESDEFLSYGGGIFYMEDCPKILDHAAVVVGYGSENGEDYWIVKNSLGVDWGEDGYVRMARNKNNNCYIASYARFPLNY